MTNTFYYCSFLHRHFIRNGFILGFLPATTVLFTHSTCFSRSRRADK